MAERITSRANPLMVHIRKLVSSRSYRYETGEYLGDGVKLLEEAVRWNAELTVVVHTPETALPPLPETVRVVEVPADVMRSISPMEAPQGALFLARIPGRDLPKKLSGSCFLALEGVQDPGNVGTILRAADAFEANGLFLLPGCADLYNHKTVRASMGAVFRCPVWNCTLEELCALAEASWFDLYGAALREDAVEVQDICLLCSIVLIGNEGRGLSPEALAACKQTVCIPIGKNCESLNAAMAATIFLWEGARAMTGYKF